MGMLFTNNAASALANPISAGATSFELANGAAFPQPTNPTDFFLVTFELNGVREIVRCSGRSGGTFTVDTGGRGQEGTTAVGWAAGATVSHRLTAGNLNELKRMANRGVTNTWL